MQQTKRSSKRKRTPQTGAGAAAQPPAKRQAIARSLRPEAMSRQRKNAAAAAYAQGQTSMEPKITASYRSTRIRHRELVASVVGTSAWTTLIALQLNPGLPTTFPWLSTQAQGWEQYRFHSLKACYYTRCATSTSGSMMIVPDYDAADAAPGSEFIASSYRDVVEEVPWVVEASCRLDPAAMHPQGLRKFVRTTALAANLDIKTYDAGTLYVGTVDGSATNWGKLWLEYDIEMYVPQLPPSGPTGQSSFLTGNGSVSNTAIFGTGATVTSFSNNIASAATMTLTFLSIGTFNVLVTVQGSGSPVLSESSATATIGGYLVTNSSVASSFQAAVTVTASGQAIVFSCTNTVTQSLSSVVAINAAEYAAILTVL